MTIICTLKSRIWTLLTGLLGLSLLMSLPSLGSTMPSQPQGKAALIEVEGVIGPATQSFIEKSLKSAASKKAALVILRLDTPGGLLQSTHHIVRAILNAPLPVVVYVAPQGARAASAGTYITYASHIAAMAPGTHLGAATPVSIGFSSPTPEKPAKAGDKKQASSSKNYDAKTKKAIEDSKAYIISLAELRGRNAQWAARAVTEGESLSAEQALRMKVIDLMATNLPSLLQKIDGKTVKINGQSLKLSTQNLSVYTIPVDWKTRLLKVITHPYIAYLLLIIGIYGLFFEIANPGLILPGVIGAISLILGLYALQMLPIYYAGLGLICFGCLLLIGEAIAPSFGILGISGALSFVIGSLLLMRETTTTLFSLSLIGSIALVASLITFITARLAILSHKSQPVSGREGLLNQQGHVVKKESNGQVWVKVNGELWKAKAHPATKMGEKIIVTAVHGLILSVETDAS